MSEVEIFSAKLADWKLRFDGPDAHCVTRQINQLIWRSAYYRSVNESRKFLIDGPEGGKQANGSLHELIDDAYFIINSIGIRRLLDDGEMSGKRGVYSLYGLLRDINSQARLITRENVLGARNLEYDYVPIKRRAFSAAPANGFAFISGDRK